MQISYTKSFLTTIRRSVFGRKGDTDKSDMFCNLSERHYEDALEILPETLGLPEKMAKPETKTVKLIVAIPKDKIIRQFVQQLGKPSRNDPARTAIKRLTSQKL